ncbi:APC family permease [Candidatus Bipolaricaulota bacterium]
MGQYRSFERSSLRRAISFREYVGLGFGAIVGMGWVVYTGNWLVTGGPIGAILGFLLGGLLLIPVGLCYAELTPAMPVAGGEIAFSFSAFGPKTAFLSGWLLAFAYIFLCPFETIALGWLLEKIFPVIQTPALYVIGGNSVSLSTILPGVLLGGGMILVNYLGVEKSARFQLFASLGMVLCVGLFVAMAFMRGSFSNMIPLFSRTGPWWVVAPSAILPVLVSVPFWLSGFDTIPQVAEESGEGLRPGLLGVAVILSIALGTLFYVLVVGAVSVVLPWQESVTLDMPTADALGVAFGQVWIMKLVLVAAFIGLMTSLNGFFLAATRLLFSGGRSGLFPKWFGALDEKHKTPRNAIVFVGLFAVSGPFLGKGSLGPIVHVGAFAFAAVWLITCLCAIRLRRTQPQLMRPHQLAHIGILYLGVAVCTAIVLILLVPGSPEQLAWPLEYCILLGWLLAGYIGHRWQSHKSNLSREDQGFLILGDGSTAPREE